MKVTSSWLTISSVLFFVTGCAGPEIHPERPAESFEEAAIIDQRDGELLDPDLLESPFENPPKKTSKTRFVQPAPTQVPSGVSKNVSGDVSEDVSEAELIDRAELAMYAAQARMDALRARAWDVTLERRAELNLLAGRMAANKDHLQERLAKYRASNGSEALRREVVQAIKNTKELLSQAPAGTALLN